MAELYKIVGELYKNPVPSMPIIKEIHKEEKVQDIWGVKDLTPVPYLKAGNIRRKIKISKKKKIEATKAASRQDELDHQTRVREISMEADSSRPKNTAYLSSSTALPLDPLLSALAIIGATTNMSIPDLNGTTDAESGDRPESPMLTLLELVPSAPRYVITPIFTLYKHWG